MKEEAQGRYYNAVVKLTIWVIEEKKIYLLVEL